RREGIVRLQALRPQPVRLDLPRGQDFRLIPRENAKVLCYSCIRHDYLVFAFHISSHGLPAASHRGGRGPVDGDSRWPDELYPTLPSISSSISRFSSTAYSRGSSFAIGSMNPRTTMVAASSSERPRLIR